MWKNILGFLLIIGSCKTVEFPIQQIREEVIIPKNNEFFGNLSPWTFKFNDGYKFGTACIINHHIITAAHCVSREKRNGRDFTIIGLSEKGGLSLCLEVHENGDWFYYYSITTGVNCGQLENKSEIFYYISLYNYIIPGESGTPVFCRKHDQVIGIITHYLSLNIPTGIKEGMITRIYEKDVNYNE